MWSRPWGEFIFFKEYQNHDRVFGQDGRGLILFQTGSKRRTPPPVFCSAKAKKKSNKFTSKFPRRTHDNTTRDTQQHIKCLSAELFWKSEAQWPKCHDFFPREKSDWTYMFLYFEFLETGELRSLALIMQSAARFVSCTFLAWTHNEWHVCGGIDLKIARRPLGVLQLFVTFVVGFLFQNFEHLACLFSSNLSPLLAREFFPPPPNWHQQNLISSRSKLTGGGQQCLQVGRFQHRTDRTCRWRPASWVWPASLSSRYPSHRPTSQSSPLSPPGWPHVSWRLLLWRKFHWNDAAQFYWIIWRHGSTKLDKKTMRVPCLLCKQGKRISLKWCS